MQVHVKIKLTDSYDCELKDYQYKEFDYEYFDETLIRDFKVAIANVYGDKEPTSEVFFEYGGSDTVQTRDEVKFNDLVSLMGNTLTVSYPCGIGGVFEREEGIVFFFRPNESGHGPHVHANNSGDIISINLLSFQTEGSMNHTKMKKAIKYAKKHQAELIQKYNEFSHGIVVDNITINDN